MINQLFDQAIRGIALSWMEVVVYAILCYAGGVLTAVFINCFAAVRSSFCKPGDQEMMRHVRKTYGGEPQGHLGISR